MNVRWLADTLVSEMTLKRQNFSKLSTNDKIATGRVTSFSFPSSGQCSAQQGIFEPLTSLSVIRNQALEQGQVMAAVKSRGKSPKKK